MDPRRLLQLNFDIDKYINPAIPSSPIPRLPRPISRFLGYREKPGHTVGNVLCWLWSFIGAFSGIALIAGVFKTSALIQSIHAPIIIGSFGAAAILEYNSIESTFAQPRNLILGHFLSALVGVSITKLFLLLPYTRFEDLRWLAGSLAVGVASVVMGVTKTVHPPAGATALLAVTSDEVMRLGWDLLALVLLGSILMLGSACLLNNIHRQFPLYWWTPDDVGVRLLGQDGSTEKSPENANHQMQKAINTSNGPIYKFHQPEIKITSAGVVCLDRLEIHDWERSVLEALRKRLINAAVPDTDESDDTTYSRNGHAISPV